MHPRAAGSLSLGRTSTVEAAGAILVCFHRGGSELLVTVPGFRISPGACCSSSISGLVAEYIVAIEVTRVRFPADALAAQPRSCAFGDLCSPLMTKLPVEEEVVGEAKHAKGVWRSGSAFDSRSEGWEFESLCPHSMLCPAGCSRLPQTSILLDPRGGWTLQKLNDISTPDQKSAGPPRGEGAFSSHVAHVPLGEHLATLPGSCGPESWLVWPRSCRAHLPARAHTPCPSQRLAAAMPPSGHPLSPGCVFPAKQFPCRRPKNCR